jgi:hypothetical protein
VDVVPQIVVGGNGGNGTTSGSSLMERLLAMLLSERMGTAVSGNGSATRPEAVTVRDQIMQRPPAEQLQRLFTLAFDHFL